METKASASLMISGVPAPSRRAKFVADFSKLILRSAVVGLRVSFSLFLAFRVTGTVVMEMEGEGLGE